jgi:hypothetical protein
MSTPDMLTQVQQAIQEERTRREYNVVVRNARTSYGIAGIPVPDGLEAYVATSTCTEPEHRLMPCIWVDFAFHLKDRIHVILQNDLVCPGLTLEESVTILLESLREEGTP